jgi:hypothetical protein
MRPRSEGCAFLPWIARQIARSGYFAFALSCNPIFFSTRSRDTGSVLVHTHDGGVDHLHRRVVAGGQRLSHPAAAKIPFQTRIGQAEVGRVAAMVSGHYWHHLRQTYL